MLSLLIVWTLCYCSGATLSYAAPIGAAAGGDGLQGDAERVRAESWARVDHSTRKLLLDVDAFLVVGVLAEILKCLFRRFTL
ncbi:hypothetical protein BSKO_04847 [Bryopsis sp. KO-2023]|nr:hypothetical protein BSKO_04847 [Bryopsis sp. KO-2023]